METNRFLCYLHYYKEISSNLLFWKKNQQKDSSLYSGHYKLSIFKCYLFWGFPQVLRCSPEEKLLALGPSWLYPRPLDWNTDCYSSSLLATFFLLADLKYLEPFPYCLSLVSIVVIQTVTKTSLGRVHWRKPMWRFKAGLLRQELKQKS